MRRRLSTRRASNTSKSQVNHSRSHANAGAHHGTEGFRGPEKKNPAVGTPGQIFLLSEFTVSSMRPGCCSWRPRALSGFFIVQPNFYSCSSTFLFFSNVSKFNRTLCDFASFSVCLRTHSSLGGDSPY